MKILLIALILGAVSLTPSVGLAKPAAEPAPIVIQSGDIAPAPTPWSDPVGSRLFTHAQGVWQGRDYGVHDLRSREARYSRCGHRRGWGRPIMEVIFCIFLYL